MSLDVEDAIRAKILARVLPGQPQAVDYVAGGSTERCDGCDARILSSDMEYGLKAASGRVLRFHRRCYWVWVDTATSVGHSSASEPGS